MQIHADPDPQPWLERTKLIDTGSVQHLFFLSSAGAGPSNWLWPKVPAPLRPTVPEISAQTLCKD